MPALDDTWNALVDGSGDPPGNPHLRKMVLVHARNKAQHPEEAARLEALMVLRRIGGPDSLTTATAFVGDISLTVRRRLLQIALEAGRDGLPVLRRLARDPDPQLAVDSIRRLTDAGDRAATTTMRKLLDARHAVVRGRAAVFLGTFGGPSLVPSLRRLSEPDDAARSAIAWAIATLEGRTEDPPPGTGETWAGLALDDAGTAVQTVSEDEAVDAESVEADVDGDESGAGDAEARVAGSLEEVQARIPPADATPVEAVAEATPDLPVPSTPAERESKPEPPPTGPAPTEADGGVLGILRAIAVHPDRREELVARLRSADERELSEAFRSRRPGEHTELNVGAALAAADLGNSRWLSPVRRLATDPDPGVRIAVAEALGALCTPSVYRNLETLVQDADPEVAVAAMEALVVGAGRLDYQGQARRLIEMLPNTEDDTLKEARKATLAALESA